MFSVFSFLRVECSQVCQQKDLLCMNKAKDKPNKKRRNGNISVDIPPEAKEELRKLAKGDKKTLAGYVRLVLIAWSKAPRKIIEEIRFE